MNVFEDDHKRAIFRAARAPIPQRLYGQMSSHRRANGQRRVAFVWLETDAREMSGLLARLTPATPEASSPSAPDAPASGRPSALRLLGPEQPPSGREERRAPGGNEEPR